MRKIGLFFAAILVLSEHEVSAEEYITVSVFSPVNARNFVKKVQEFSFRPASGPNATALDDAFDFKFANSIDNVSPTDPYAVSKVVKPPPNVVRRNVVVQNSEQLNAALESAKLETAKKDQKIIPVLLLDLFDNVHLKITTQSIKRIGDRTFSIAGYIEDMPGSLATLVKSGNDLSGTIITYSDLYEIRPSQTTTLSSFTDGVTLEKGTTLSVIDEVKKDFKNEAEPKTPITSKKRSSVEFDVNPSAKGDVQKLTIPKIDIAVVYTPLAEERAGGTAAIDSLVVQAIQSVQSSLDAYKVAATVDLVYSGKTNYRESGDIQWDRDRLQDGTDGVMDDVPDMRNNVKADVVALIIESDPNKDHCGASYMPEEPNLDYADYAYMVIVRACAVVNLSFVHEFGHILGMRHDRYVDPIENKPIAANHGMIFQCGNNICRDIPAYPNFCEKVLNKSCARVSAWSGAYWPGGSQIKEYPDDYNDAQRALRFFAPVVAKYR